VSEFIYGGVWERPWIVNVLTTFSQISGHTLLESCDSPLRFSFSGNTEANAEEVQKKKIHCLLSHLSVVYGCVNNDITLKYCIHTNNIYLSHTIFT